MKKKPIIGIISRIEVENDTAFIKLNQEYCLAIINSGGIPFIILPPTDMYCHKSNGKKLTEEEKQDIYIILSKCDGILIPGGSNWSQLDETICKYSIKYNIPILGICLGMQVLGNMEEHDDYNIGDKTIKNNTQLNHCQKTEKYVHNCYVYDGLLYSILKVDKIRVNSRHNYHIDEQDYFHVDARSEDGLIEAIHIPTHKFALGVQWHPESMITYDNNMKKIFNAFIESAKK